MKVCVHKLNVKFTAYSHVHVCVHVHIHVHAHVSATGNLRIIPNAKMTTPGGRGNVHVHVHIHVRCIGKATPCNILQFFVYM